MCVCWEGLDVAAGLGRFIFNHRGSINEKKNLRLGRWEQAEDSLCDQTVELLYLTSVDPFLMWTWDM